MCIYRFVANFLLWKMEYFRERHVLSFDRYSTLQSLLIEGINDVIELKKNIINRLSQR